jgi:hypothetical protein
LLKLIIPALSNATTGFHGRLSVTCYKPCRPSERTCKLDQEHRTSQRMSLHEQTMANAAALTLAD